MDTLNLEVPSGTVGGLITGTKNPNSNSCEEIEIALTENNVLPSEYVQAQYESKGFYTPKRILLMG